MSPPLRFRLRFRRKQRIRLQRDFRRIFRKRCSQGRGPVVLYVFDAGLGYPRLGLHVGKRVGNAVVRNREKRLAREAFRTLQHDLPPLDMIVVLKKPGLSVAEYTHTLRVLASEGAKKLARRSAFAPATAEGNPSPGRS